MRGTVFIVCLGVSCSRPWPQGEDPVWHNKLSEFGILSWTGTDLEPIGANSRSYEVAVPLFSDYAGKYRTISLPAGSYLKMNGADVPDFPVGSIISKTFYYDELLTPSGWQKKRLETRLLLRRKSGWEAMSYLWNEAQTDATSVPGGRKLQLTIRAQDTLSGGSSRIYAFAYQIPSRNQCGSCHHRYSGDSQVLSPIGTKPQQLAAHLQEWAASGFIDQNIPVRPVTWIAEHRKRYPTRLARAYLDANCAHCHSPSGSAGRNSGLDLREENDDPVTLGICKIPGSAGKGNGGYRYDIVPGDPEHSILHFRVRTTDSGAMMPQLGRAITHESAAGLLADWILSLPAASCKGA